MTSHQIQRSKPQIGCFFFYKCACIVTKLALLSFLIYVHWTSTVFTTVPFALLWIIGNPQFNTVCDPLICCSHQVVGVSLGSGSRHRLIMPAGQGSLYFSCCCCHSGWHYKSHLFSVTAETRVEITAQSTLPAIAASWMLRERSLIKQQVFPQIIEQRLQSWLLLGGDCSVAKEQSRHRQQRCLPRITAAEENKKTIKLEKQM